MIVFIGDIFVVWAIVNYLSCYKTKFNLRLWLVKFEFNVT